MKAHINNQSKKEAITEAVKNIGLRFNMKKILPLECSRINKPDDFTLQYQLKNKNTGEWQNTGIEIDTVDVDMYDSLSSVYHAIASKAPEQFGYNTDKAAFYKDTSVHTIFKLDDYYVDVRDLSKYAMQSFDKYMGAGSMAGITTARFGKAKNVHYAFVMSVILHLLIALTQASNEIVDIDAEEIMKEADGE